MVTRVEADEAVRGVLVGRYRYHRIRESEIPDGLRWDTPARHGGQITEVQYAEPGARYVQDEGATYRRVVDHAHGTAYYRLAEAR